jgi:tetratricopeptide (TPR) repeat protein
VFGIFRKLKTWREHFDEGRIYGQGCNFAKAEASFREAVHLAPTEPYPHYELGYTLSLQGQHKKALEEFRRTDNLSCGFLQVQTEAYICEQYLFGAINIEVLVLLRCLQRLMDHSAAQSEEALAASRRCIELAPQFALGHFYLGKALLGREPNAAEQALRCCIELGPDDTTAIDSKFHLGLLRQHVGEETDARRIWSGIVADYPGNPHTKIAELMSGQGSA